MIKTTLNNLSTLEAELDSRLGQNPELDMYMYTALWVFGSMQTQPKFTEITYPLSPIKFFDRTEATTAESIYGNLDLTYLDGLTQSNLKFKKIHTDVNKLITTSDCINYSKQSTPLQTTATILTTIVEIINIHLQNDPNVILDYYDKIILILTLIAKGNINAAILAILENLNSRQFTELSVRIINESLYMFPTEIKLSIQDLYLKPPNMLIAGLQIWLFTELSSDDIKDCFRDETTADDPHISMGAINEMKTHIANSSVEQAILDILYQAPPYVAFYRPRINAVI